MLMEQAGPSMGCEVEDIDEARESQSKSGG